MQKKITADNMQLVARKFMKKQNEKNKENFKIKFPLNDLTF